MLRKRQSAILFLGFIFLTVPLSIHSAQKKQQQSYYLKPDQSVDLASDSKLITAKQNCENWALAAGLETMLQQQSVTLNQNFWVMRLNGGELCLTDSPAIEALAQVVTRNLYWTMAGMCVWNSILFPGLR